MGNKKRGIIDTIMEGDKIGKEAVESGEKLEKDGSEIKSILKGIDTSMDEDDLAAVESTETAYSSEFKSAFKENTEMKKNEMEGIENEGIDIAEGELEKVNDASDKFREMSGVTDLGRNSAENAEDKMRRSATEYEGFVTKANSIIENTKSEVDSLKNSIESIFG